MLKLLKVFLRGIVVTLLSPFILAIWVIYGVYCIGLFVFMFIKSTIEYFRGLSFNAELPEDLEAKRIVLEKEKRDEQAKQMLSSMYEKTMAQQTVNFYDQNLKNNENTAENHDFIDDLTKENPLEKEKDNNGNPGIY